MQNIDVDIGRRRRHAAKHRAEISAHTRTLQYKTANVILHLLAQVTYHAHDVPNDGHPNSSDCHQQIIIIIKIGVLFILRPVRASLTSTASPVAGIRLRHTDDALAATASNTPLHHTITRGRSASIVHGWRRGVRRIRQQCNIAPVRNMIA